MLRLSHKMQFFLIIFLCLQSSCTPSPPSLEPESQAVSLLAQLDQPAFIKRDGWKDYQPVSFGALIYPTDLLKTNGNITLVCADLQTVKPVTGEGRNPCPLPSGGFALKYDNMLFSPGLRGTTASTIPILISPRNTTILEQHPLLRWQDTGAVNYSVEIRQGGESIWMANDVADTEIVYPADAPTLESGKDYLLVVMDNTTGHSSTEDKEKGLGFQVVSDIQRTEIEARQKDILKLNGVDGSARKLALAMYYSNLNIYGRGLWGEAGWLAIMGFQCGVI